LAADRSRAVAVVTGAEQGLGRELARRLAAHGLLVWPTARDLDLSRAVVREIEQAGGEARAASLDVLLDASVARFVDLLGRECGRLEVLVNNAGVSLDRIDSAIDADLGVVRETLETNLFGAWRVTSALTPLLRASGRARVVNISSTMGQLEGIGHTAPAYRISKAALNAFTGMVAHELHGTGILVNAVDPGWMRTALGGPSAPLSVEEGAEEPLRLALLPETGTTGGFYFRGQLIPW
jgi:NAD(P)-dependent dehydrogenase (short-subunit alcohol dehydrogenase family)